MSVAARMREFESALDQRAPPENFLVARIDGRNFTRLTRERHRFKAPFDERFRDLMVIAARHLMDCGFRVRLAYLQSDEISLLLDKNDATFGRSMRKILSLLAAEASASFSVALGAVGAFDCRLSVLPTVDRVVDYFLWRQGDAFRNALNAYCYWMLRDQGGSAEEATAHLRGMASSAKHDLLFAQGINFNDVPVWQRRGIGLCWGLVRGEGVNPISGEPQQMQRRRLIVDESLPMGDGFADWVRRATD